MDNAPEIAQAITDEVEIITTEPRIVTGTIGEPGMSEFEKKKQQRTIQNLITKRYLQGYGERKRAEYTTEKTLKQAKIRLKRWLKKAQKEDLTKAPGHIAELVRLFQK